VAFGKIMLLTTSFHTLSYSILKRSFKEQQREMVKKITVTIKNLLEGNCWGFIF